MQALPAMQKEQCHPPSSWDPVGFLPATARLSQQRDGADPGGRLLPGLGRWDSELLSPPPTTLVSGVWNGLNYAPRGRKKSLYFKSSGFY